MVTMPNKRERTLLALFLVALLVAGGGLAWRGFSRHLEGQRSLLDEKNTQLAEARQWLAEKEQWMAKKNWMSANHPPVYEGQQSEATYVREMQAAFAQNKIEIQEQRIQETRLGADLIEVQIDLVLSASLENLISWLHQSQPPSAFRTVQHIRLKSDEGNSKIRAEISVVQLYEKPEQPAAK